MTIEKRPLCRDDAAVISVLHARCFADEAWSQSQIEGSLLLPTTRGEGLWDGGVLVGFYLVQCVGDEIEILTICVDPSHRRQGLGRDLVRHLIVQQRTGSVFLEVAKDNLSALALYESMGFCLIGCRPDYYHRKDKLVDALNYRYLVNG
ncbi:MAG: GNAT family N-acetyltransferase [Alphaproteobacteria bacterium]|nr:GNAT family N-acetyltransferase [Alphaproteobacteria bacterium]